MLKKRPEIWILSAIYALSCIISVVHIYYFDFRHTFSTNSLFSYWNDYFVATDSLLSFLKSFGEGIRKLTAWWFGKGKFFMRLGSILIPLFLAPMIVRGVKSLRQNKFMIYGLDSLGLVIFLELFVLGALKKYPFTGGRITLFFAPFVFYFIIKGISYFKMNKFIYFCANIYYTAFLATCSINSALFYISLYK